jgi:hypothetical protein
VLRMDVLALPGGGGPTVLYVRVMQRGVGECFWIRIFCFLYDCFLQRQSTAL